MGEVGWRVGEVLGVVNSPPDHEPDFSRNKIEVPHVKKIYVGFWARNEGRRLVKEFFFENGVLLPIIPVFLG